MYTWNRGIGRKIREKRDRDWGNECLMSLLNSESFFNIYRENYQHSRKGVVDILEQSV